MKNAEIASLPTTLETDQLITLFNAGLDVQVERQAGLLLERFPNSGFTWKAMGLALQMQGKNALPALTNAAALLPDDAELQSKLGDALQASGHFDLAVASYHKALAISPDLAETHNNLGVALRGLRQPRNAVLSCTRALEIKPDYAMAHNNLGGALHDLGQLHDAAASYRAAVTIKPEFSEAQNNLGLVLQELGKLDEAVASYRLAITLNRDFAEAHNNLGLALQDLGQPEQAIASCRRALEIKPDFAKAHNNLGLALKAFGQLDDATCCYRRALEIKPDYAEAHNNLGVVFQFLGQLDDAAACFRQALAIRGDYAISHNNLGRVLEDCGLLGDAETCYRRALAVDPALADAHNNLGHVLVVLGRPDEAVTSYRQAVAIEPDHAIAHNGLSAALQVLGQFEDALTSCHTALAINPDYAEAHNNLGGVLQWSGQLDAAAASYRNALAIKPNFATAHSNLLFVLAHSGELDAKALFAQHCRFGDLFEGPLRGVWPKHTNSRHPDRCLRLGFISADFFNHPVASFIEPALALLSTNPQFSLHAYSNNAIEDSVTKRLKGYFEKWNVIFALSDDALAKRIQEDGIDILIELSGHTAHNRLLSLARKPAPVQVSWMGYPGTTGLRAVDYYLSDRFFLPPGQFDPQFVEKIIRLPASAPFQPSQYAPPVNALPAQRNGYLTFGSFNRHNKISRSVIALWCAVLRLLPDSRMVLGGNHNGGADSTLIKWFNEESIDIDRLMFHPKCGLAAYLELHHQIDICLDTFPYSGGTTSLHALWMGVPTLTLAGGTPASRTGACILGHVGLEDFIASSKADFGKKGQSWANRIDELIDIRASLRERLANSAAGHPHLAAEGLEKALRIIWQRWCAGEAPRAFEVTQQGTQDAVSGVTG